MNLREKISLIMKDCIKGLSEDVNGEFYTIYDKDKVIDEVTKMISSKPSMKPVEERAKEYCENVGGSIYNAYIAGAKIQEEESDMYYLQKMADLEKPVSDKVIKRILELAWEYAASDVEVNNLTEEGEFEYVIKHLNNLINNETESN